ncbi:hypothetical protein ACHAW5_000596 [Stephanodiscus triporus]|uniref:DUF6314 domain-containing protein n=1 Tax=Stephanodiscus triporus TaxID=2934178 RepID=A0ABD3NUB2_9STRA
MLEVAVIGAGCSGLVAARQLIQAGLRPTIFEVAKTVGGAWTPSSSSMLTTQTPAPSSSAPAPPPHAPSEDQNAVGIRSTSADHRRHNHPASKMWKGMSTNLSKYTCRFSDWPWSDDASIFPSVEEMHDYLESYAAAYLSSSCDFQFECNVFNVEQLVCSSSSQDSTNNYKVEWTDLKTKTTHRRDFGGVVVATGFFHTPRWPSFLTKQIGSGQKSKSFGGNIKPQLMHSSEYRSHHSFRGKKVAVVGSSFSALEIASDLSLSVARVVNVSPSVPWVLPRWIPTMQPLYSNGQKNNDISAITILPADLVLYRRNQAYPKIPETISLTPKDCRERHEYLQSLVGHRQRDSKLGEPTNFDEPPFVAISDEYLNLVREDKVEVVHGRLVGIGDDGTLNICEAQFGSDNPNPPSHSIVLDDIDHIICCTGFAPNFGLLSPGILSSINYDPEDSFAPVTLAWDTFHPSLPNLAFCGMYRGPYMGIVELQARLAAGVMSGRISLERKQIQSAVKASEAIRNAIPRAQFPHFDYTGFMDTLSQLCFQGNYPRHNVEVFDAVIPTFYQPDDGLSQKCQSEIEKEHILGQDGSRVPKMILQSILGKWRYDRHIVHLQTRKVERVYGTVKYSKYWSRSNPENENAGNADELLFSVNDTKKNPVLYREDGFYEFTPTQKFEVFREYEYESKHDALDIFFVEGGRRAHLFLSLKFVPETIPALNSSDDDGYWVKATSDHLCIKDLYSATFRVKLKGLSASEIIIKYRVKGPSKDYESTTILKPLSP